MPIVWYNTSSGRYRLEYLKVSKVAEKWGISERTVRNYCANNRVEGAVLIGKIWHIPKNAKKPSRANQKKNTNYLLNTLLREKKSALKGGIYHKIQIEFTYNSNHIEGSTLSHDQTKYIYETRLVGAGTSINVDDVVETANHFRCIDMVIENANYRLSEAFIKKLHFMLKNGTSDARKDWFAVGEYKKLPNEVGGKETEKPEDVSLAIKNLLEYYHQKEGHKKVPKTLDDLLDFHYQFERIHPFQDGNGRVGRLILLKECLKYNIVPFIIDEELKLFYYRGLDQWEYEKGYLRDTCLTAQDKFKGYLDYFRIPYRE